MQSRIHDHIPRYGWTRKTLIDGLKLGDGGGTNPSVSEAFRRPAGMFQAAVIMSVPGGTTVGAGEFGVVLEGSNTGDESNPLEWFQVASSSASDQFISPQANDQVLILGGASIGSFVSMFGTSGNVSLGRFAYLRLRSQVKLGTITVLTFPTGLAATVTITGGSGITNTLVPADGARTPGLDDYNNTLGSTALIAADILAAINDAANSFKVDVFATLSGSTLTIRPQVIGTSNTGFSMYSGAPAELEVGPSFDEMTVRMTGIAWDGEGIIKTEFINSASGESNSQVSGVVRRPEGTKFITTTVKLVRAIWDPPNAEGYTLTLQGAVDQASVNNGEWFNIERTGIVDGVSPPPDDGDTILYNATGGIVLDMGPFNFFRVAVEPTGGPAPTDVSTYQFQWTAAFDDNDWLNGEESLSELSSTLQAQFFQVRWDTPGDEIGTKITITGQILDMNGVPIVGDLTGNRQIFLILSTTFTDKDNSLHPTATMASFNNIGSVTNSNRIAIKSTAGSFEVVVDGNGTPGEVYLSADPYTNPGPGNSSFPDLLISSTIERLIFS